MQNENCRYFMWDEDGFELPHKYILNCDSVLADALNVFYSVGGYNFFNVTNPEHYASNWLDFVGNLYEEIIADKYPFTGKQYKIPLNDEQKQELSDRGVPKVFITDIN